MNLFQLGAFKLHSGEETGWKICCESLTDDDWQCLAAIAYHTLPPFSSIEGVPTGNSMNDYLGNRQARGCVVFCRGVCPPWVIPLFRMPESYADQMTAAPFK